MPRSKAIDILRAVAVFLVLGRHMDLPSAKSSSLVHSLTYWLMEHWNRGGWVGVDLFFVLSGFLVSGLLFREHQKFGAISGKSFLIRRGFKIYPAFWVLIGATGVEMLLRREFHLNSLLHELLFVQNYYQPVWNHTWSLAVEEHFYICLLLFLLFLSWRNSPSLFRPIPRAFFVLAVACLSLRVFTAYMVRDNYWIHFSPSHLRMDSLFCGVTISYLYHYHSAKFLDAATRYRVPALLLGIVALAPAFVFPVETVPFISTFGLTLFYIGSGLILIAFLTVTVPDNKLARSVVYVGSHSYSMYLWHMPLVLWCLPPLARALGQYWTWSLYFASYLLGSVVLGILMALAIEFPLLKARDRWFPSRGRPLTISSAGSGDALQEAGSTARAAAPPLTGL